MLTLRGGIKKKILVFFRKTPKGGGRGLAESEISLSEETEIFLEFLKDGGVLPIPKGCYHKKWGYWDIFAKKGVLTQSIGILTKTENISEFFAKRGGGSRQFRNFLIRKNGGLQVAGRGRGGLRISKFF